MLSIQDITPTKIFPKMIAYKLNIIDISKLIINRMFAFIMMLLLPYYKILTSIIDPTAIPIKVATFIIELFAIASSLVHLNLAFKTFAV
jgi:hypothetical protein